MISRYRVQVYKNNGSILYEFKTDTLKEAESIYRVYGLNKKPWLRPTIWEFSPSKMDYVRLADY